MVHHAAWVTDEGEDIRQVAAMVKVFTTDMVNRAADRTVQIHGGPIYAEERPIERLCRNATAAGATEHAMDLQKAIIVADLLRGVGT